MTLIGRLSHKPFGKERTRTFFVFCHTEREIHRIYTLFFFSKNVFLLAREKRRQPSARQCDVTLREIISLLYPFFFFLRDVSPSLSFPRPCLFIYVLNASFIFRRKEIKRCSFCGKRIAEDKSINNKLSLSLSWRHQRGVQRRFLRTLSERRGLKVKRDKVLKVLGEGADVYFLLEADRQSTGVVLGRHSSANGRPVLE